MIIKDNNKADYSLEFAHIYLNEAVSVEHVQSAKNTLKLIQRLENEGATYTLNVLIDDYNATEKLLDIDDYLEVLKNIGTYPDFMGYEAILEDYKEDIFEAIEDKKMKKSYDRYIHHNGKIPCSLMVAVWYLLRLGLIPLKKQLPYKVLSKNQDNFVAKQIINILPERYRAVEEKALRIIYGTKFSNYVNNIDFIFFDSAIEVSNANSN